MTCRICTANDEEALIEQLAEDMWMTQSSTDPDDEWEPWEKASPYWQRIRRNFARASLAALRRGFAI